MQLRSAAKDAQMRGTGYRPRFSAHGGRWRQAFSVLAEAPAAAQAPGAALWMCVYLGAWAKPGVAAGTGVITKHPHSKPHPASTRSFIHPRIKPSCDFCYRNAVVPLHGNLTARESCGTDTAKTAYQHILKVDTLPLAGISCSEEKKNQPSSDWASISLAIAPQSCRQKVLERRFRIHRDTRLLPSTYSR